MIRKIIKIDEEKCTGCGLCATACHEGAIGMVNGKAKLLREHFCDGLGDCLPACPAGAISFEEREAPAYDEAAVMAAKRAKAPELPKAHRFGGCPGSMPRKISRPESQTRVVSGNVSELTNFPVQIKLAPVRAPFFDGADLLVAADCTAFARADVHERFIKGRVVLIGCPKLDSVDYTEKLSAILSSNDIKSVTILRMEVPCCGGIVRAVEGAVGVSGKDIPVRTVIISTNGEIVI